MKERMAVQNDTEKLLSALVTSIADLKPKPEIKEGDAEYEAIKRAEGFYDEFEIPVYQNAYEAQARGLSKEIRDRAVKLRNGRYIKTVQNPGGRVEVSNNGKEVVIAYPVSGDNMMQNTQHWSSFSDLINKIWDEMHAAVQA